LPKLAARFDHKGSTMTTNTFASRRGLLLTAAAAAAAAATAGRFAFAGPASAPEAFEVNYTEAQWRARLTAAQFAVLRQEGTERPGYSPLNQEHRAGSFACAGCALPLFSSKTKFDSGTGWPSFWKPLDGAIRTRRDLGLGMLRTEVHCRRCGGHLGHVFDDGPPPTGLRYCMNGVAMSFTAA